jgi:hypothetical protein
MPAEDDDQYLRYVVARLSSFHDIWWSMANEFDLMRAKKLSDFDRFFQILVANDPYKHLRSIHYSKVMYDYSNPWITHVGNQSGGFEEAAKYRKMWMKPIIFDEVGYEGNLNRRWGCLSSAEMTRRIWRGVQTGSYVTHGECLLTNPADYREDSSPTLWWSHGGKLHGDTAKKISFLKTITEAAVDSAPHRIGWDPVDDPYYSYATLSDPGGDYVVQVLYFFDLHQPVWYEFPLPEGEFSAEYLDPEECTVTPIEGRFSGKTHITLTGKPYQAVRFRRLS